MSIFKNFRKYKNDPASFNTLSPRFDQPTYLSFKLDFADGNLRNAFYNNVGRKDGGLTNYDIMPHPLFAIKGSDSIEDRQTYSAIDYLYDANEFTRARMLEEFVIKFNELQSNFQWYFQKIDGVDELLKINPGFGMRVPSDKRLTITTLEGVDQRMTHLLNLYRKIAWDDTYQRWVLPDMMRYFTLDIYIAEFREFHGPSGYNGFGAATGGKRNDVLELKVLDDILPTWKIRCEMCEFDLANIEYAHLKKLNISDEPEAAEISFQIKVGKIYEEQIYPTFQNMYLLDKNLNGTDRSINQLESEQTNTGKVGLDGKLVTEKTSSDFNSTRKRDNNAVDPKTYTGIAHSTINPLDNTHISGRPFNELKDSKLLFGANAAGPDGDLTTNEDNNFAKVDPTLPNTWVGNAVNFGMSYLENTVTGFIDKAKVTPIKGLGISFNEVEAALQSKNIITALGMIKKATDAVARSYITPSQELDGDIQDDLFRSYLKKVSLSKSTEDNKLIQVAANVALNDKGIWKQITDYSKATDLVAQGETNISNPIEGGSNYETLGKESTQGDKSLATNIVGPNETNIPATISQNNIIEGVPTSVATNSQILK